MRCFAGMGISAQGVSRRFQPGFLHVASYEDTPAGDVLVHLAEASDRAYAQANAPSYEQQQLAMLETLHGKRFSRVVYASSAVLYGDRGEDTHRTGDLVYEVDAYTRLKRASELSVLAHGGVVARLANLYGPGMAEGNVLSTILKQISQDGPVRVLDTAPVRDFLWIDDAARALALIAIGGATGVFNVGSGRGVSIRELAATVLSSAGQYGRSIESVHASTRFSKLVVDIEQTEDAFGWRPAITLAEGIATLVKMNISKE